MKLVRFVCVTAGHANGHGGSSLTIHEGTWAFCSSGGDAPDHQWKPSDGLPIMDAMRFPADRVEPVPAAAPRAAARPVAAKGKARAR